MTAAYTPREGSTAYLALQYLEANGRTGELALASAVDKELHELRPLLGWAIKQGAIVSDKPEGDEWHYELGDGTPPSPAAETPPPSTAAAMTPARRGRAKLAVVAPANDEPTPPKLQRHAAQTEAAGIEIALFNTGVLYINAPGQNALRLTRDQANELVKYLQCFSAPILAVAGE